MYDLFIDPPAPLVPRHRRLEVVRAHASRTAASTRRSTSRARARRSARSSTDGVEAIAISPPARVPESRPRARAGGARRRDGARRVRVALLGGRAGDPRVRADVDDGRQRLRDAADGALPRGPRAEDPGARRARRALHHAVLGRHRDAGRRPSACRSGSSSRAPPRARSPPRAGARQAAEPRMLSFDMGGTTAKACVIDGGEPLVAREFEVARADRFKKGSGLPIRVPVIEMIEIGAGGGSIARIDRLGLLKVGPDSAGADPGPACYALGGQRAHRHRRGPRARLPRSRVLPRRPHAARRRRGEARDRGARGAAAGSRARRGGVGHSPRRQREHGRGRAHPRHRARQGPARVSAVRVRRRGPGARVAGRARCSRCRACWCRSAPGAMSAYGLLAAPLAFDFVRTAPAAAGRARTGTAINRAVRRDGGRGPRDPPRSGVADADMRVRRERRDALRRPGPRGGGRGAGGRARRARASPPSPPASRPRTARSTAGTPLGVAIEALNWRVVVSGPRAELAMRRPRPARAGRPRGRRDQGRARQAYFPEAGGYVDTPVYDRYALAAGRPRSTGPPSSRSASRPR